MSLTSEAMERTQFALELSATQAQRLQRLLTLGFDERGRPEIMVGQHMRHLLAAALREAADGCEELGVQQGDLRWTAPVTLLHGAASRVWTTGRPETFGLIAGLLDRMRITVVMLRERSLRHAVGVHLS